MLYLLTQAQTVQAFTIMLPAWFWCISHGCRTSIGQQTCLNISFHYKHIFLFQCIMDLTSKMWNKTDHFYVGVFF